jgi:hypothetical protein
LQPVIKELEQFDIKKIYLGFESGPNKGLMFTTDRAVLIRDSEVLEFITEILI